MMALSSTLKRELSVTDLSIDRGKGAFYTGTDGKSQKKSKYILNAKQALDKYELEWKCYRHV